MKTMKNAILSVVVMFLIASCVTTEKFPVSSVTPAAVIIAKIKKDKNHNYAISITAHYLASAEMLTPPKRIYVAWIKTYNNDVKNIGQLVSKTTKESSLAAISSFQPSEVFITAEDEGNISSPLGVEIARTTVKR